MTREEAKSCIGTIELLQRLAYNIHGVMDVTDANNCKKIIKALEQEPQSFKWCDTCKEYDQEKQCCHRFSKVIRDTVEEMKQEYIEREVLDKIRAEIRANSIYVMPQYGRTIREADVLHIIDKYKAESVTENGTQS